MGCLAKYVQTADCTHLVMRPSHNVVISGCNHVKNEELLVLTDRGCPQTMLSL